MSNKCTVYIDEAGDLGINRGTRWFVLTAVIVNKDSEPPIRSTIKSIKANLNIRHIHFRELRSFEQKAYVVNRLYPAEFEYTNIIIDTSKLEIDKLHTDRNAFTEKPGIILYNHACRYLIERVSWMLRDTGRIGEIILSARGTSRDSDLIDYINEKLLSYPENEISNQFSRICSKPAESWDMLQLADICATSMFYYHEINRYGFMLPCFASKLRSHLYQRNGSANKYGIKYYSEDMRPDSTYFTDNMVCK